MSVEARGWSSSTAGKLGLLTTLYFSQGLPFGFFVQALPVLLRKSGYSLGQIGLASLLAMPWALKFLWAPAVDRLSFGKLGRRRSWILPLQLLTASLLLGLALAPGGGGIPLLLGAVLVVNLLAATQDIATDGLAVEMLERHERGLANGIQVGGYRVGMIVGGGLLLMLFETAGAPAAFGMMAGLIVLAGIPILLAREPPATPSVQGGGAIADPHFLRRPGHGRLLLLIFTYKMGDAFATAMLRPFLADLGLTLGDIGRMLGTVGFVAGLLGACAGGALVNRVGRKRSLLWFGAFQAVTVAGYAWLAAGQPTRGLLYAISAAEHFAGGMATAALFTCMMDWCRPRTSGADYTVQASTVVIATSLASALSGFSAQALGYAGHFSAAAVLAALTLLVVWTLFPATKENT